MADEKHGSSHDRLIKLGTFYGLFFVIQAYGYASGKADGAPGNLHEAIVAGVDHLSHIFKPFSAEVAWPLSPTLAGMMIMYASYLPHLFSEHAVNGAVRKQNRLFFSLVAGISLTTILPFVFDRTAIYGTLLDARLGSAFFMRFEWIPYLAGLSFVTWMIWRLAGARIDRICLTIAGHPVWRDLASAACIALLYLVTYIGSRFDGVSDRLS